MVKGLHNALALPLIRILVTQASWWGVVLTAPRFISQTNSPTSPATGLSVCLIVALINLAVWLAERPRSPKQVLLTLVLAGAGTAIDLLLFGAGFYDFPPQPLAAPIWLATLWLSFVVNFEVGFKSLMNRPVLLAVMGAIVGPMTYWAGVNIEVLRFPSGRLSLWVLAVIWSLVMPALAYLMPRISGSQSETDALKVGK